MADPLCPACGRRLTAGTLGTATVHLCLGCGGVWLGVQALRKLLDAEPGDLRRLHAQVSGAGAAPQQPSTGACPHCAAALEPLAVPELSGSLVHSCPPCRGFWFTRAALERLLPSDAEPAP